MSFCAECGTKLPENAKFCPSCGFNIQTNGNAQSKEQAKFPHRREMVVERSAEPAPEYVGLGKRFAAHLIDLIIVFTIFYAIGMQVASEVGRVTDDGFALEGTPALVTMALTFAASLLYFVLTEGRNGQSFGKKIIGIKVISADGSRCSMRQAFIRNFLRLIDGLFLYLVGIILMMRSDRKQRLGDRIADTLVVRKEKKAVKGSYVYRSGNALDSASEEDGKAKFRSSWGVKKGRDAWDI